MTNERNARHRGLLHRIPIYGLSASLFLMSFRADTTLGIPGIRYMFIGMAWGIIIVAGLLLLEESCDE